MADMFSSPAEKLQRSYRLVDSEQNFQNKSWRTFVDHERYEPQSSEANYIHLNVAIRRKSSYTLPVNTVPHGGQMESLRGKRRGLETLLVNTVAHGGQVESLRGKRRGRETPPVNTVAHGGQMESLRGKRRFLET